jgi:hypothetical protein
VSDDAQQSLPKMPETQLEQWGKYLS